MQDFIPTDILAYFDPGSGSLLVQALVGGAAGLLVFAKFVWDAALNLTHGRKSHDDNRADEKMAKVGSQQIRH